MAPDDAAVVTWGRRAWTAIGVILLAVGLVYVASQVSLVLTPFVLALFPAALLDPVAARLRATRIPDAVVALLILLVLFAVVVAAGAFIGAALVDQVPQIVDAVVAGLDRLAASVDWSVLPGDVGGLRDLVTGAGAALTSGAALSRGLLAAEAVGSFVTGLVLMVVVLFRSEERRVGKECGPSGAAQESTTRTEEQVGHGGQRTRAQRDER